MKSNLPKNFKNEIFALLIILLILILFILPLLTPLDHIFFEESSLQFYSYIDANILHYIRENKLPLWIEQFGGGYPFIDHPENPVLSPFFYLFFKPFGSALGVKIFITINYLAGAIGFYLLMRIGFGLNIFAAVYSSLIFSLNTFIAYRLNTGGIVDSLWFFLPAILLTLLLSKNKKKFILFCALLNVLVLLSGHGILFAPLILFLFCFSLLDNLLPSENRLLNKKGILLPFAIVLITTIILGAIKILPLIDLLSFQDRSIENYAVASKEAYTLPLLFKSLFHKGPFSIWDNPTPFPDGLGVGSVLYLGIFNGLIFILGIIAYPKKTWTLSALLVIFIFIMMGKNSPVDIFHFLWHFPIFRSMHYPPVNFSFLVIFLICIISGIFLHQVTSIKIEKFRIFRIIMVLVSICGIGDLFMTSQKYHVSTHNHQIAPPKICLNDDFFSVKKINYRDKLSSQKGCSKERWPRIYQDELSEGLQYFLVRQNVGLINWYGNIKYIEKASPKYFVFDKYGTYWKNFRTNQNCIQNNSGYRGEAFFAEHSQNSVEDVSFFTNKIIVAITQELPDILVINQNYNKWWQSKIGKIINSKGLIGIVLNEPNNEPVVIEYKPKPFFWGKTVTLLGFLFFALYPFLKKIIKTRHE